jgi:hypothetical protein
VGVGTAQTLKKDRDFFIPLEITMPELVDWYRCQYCRRFHRASEKAVAKHERHCFKNPRRVPYIGEATQWWQLMKLRGYSFDSDGEPWLHADKEQKLPAWWPSLGEDGVGCIWVGDKWVEHPDFDRVKYEDWRPEGDTHARVNVCGLNYPECKVAEKEYIKKNVPLVILPHSGKVFE